MPSTDNASFNNQSLPPSSSCLEDQLSYPNPLSPYSPEKISSVSSPFNAPRISTFRRIIFFFSLCSAQLLSLACLGQGLAPASLIAVDFGINSPTQESWFSASYTLTAGTLILIAGRAGDIWGHKHLVLLGYAWLALWSLLAGLSIYTKSIIFFDVCRAMQGVANALTIPNVMALLGQAYPTGEQKNKAFAIFGACAPNGFLLGALFASLMAQLAWWPWAYWVMAMYSTALVGVVLLVVPKDVRRLGTDATILEQMDWIGCLTGVIGLVLMNVSWNLAPDLGWSNAYVIVCLLAGIFLFCFFIWNEGTTGLPILPIKGISSEAIFVLLIIGLGWSSFGQALFYYFQFVQQLRHSTALSSVAQISGSSLSGLLAAMTAGRLLSKIHISLILLIASLAFCVGNILTATMPVNQSYWKQAFWIQIFMPWGMDMSFPAAAVIMSDMVPEDQQGIASSLIATIVNYSMSIGLGIGGTVVSRIRDAEGDAFAQFRGAWYAGIGLSGCGVLVALYYASVHRILGGRNSGQ